MHSRLGQIRRIGQQNIRRLEIAVLAIRNSAHIGMAGYYCNRRAEEGLVCLGFTTSEALVHPYGGAEAHASTEKPVALVPVAATV